MKNFSLWNNDAEIQFFKEALKNFASPEQLFYKLQSGYFAYIPKGDDSEGQTLQSRNSLIGKFTEKWCRNLLESISNELNLFAINDVICEEIGLTKKSSADVAFCKKDALVQKAEDIKLLFEVKMSVVSNYKFDKLNVGNTIKVVGDYKSHKGNPSLLRSDSMLKAIGKSINIRVSGLSATKIPIIILGNSPITDNYKNKVDFLKTSGVIQGFWSLNPKPTESNFIKNTDKFGFQTIDNVEQITKLVQKLLAEDLNYFSSMINKTDLGKIISISSKETTDMLRAEKFLSLIRT